MVSRTLNKKEVRQFQKKRLSIGFSNGFFSSKKVQRNFPVQSALHTLIDGALLGILSIVAIMSSVALHSQYLWTKSFTRLEKTRDLNRRMLESTSVMESYLLKNQKLSRNLVPTKADDLIYVDRPTPKNNGSLVKESSQKKLFEIITSFPIKSGY